MRFLHLFIILLQILQISLTFSEKDLDMSSVSKFGSIEAFPEFLREESESVFSQLKNSSDTIQESKPEISPEIEEESIKDFGSLHTLETLGYWANKEEQIYELLKKRRVGLKKEMDLINSYMKDYSETSGKALANMIVPSEDLEIRGKVIGSSAILSHRMTYRYATILRDLRLFLESEEHRDVRDSLKSVLTINKEFDDTHSFSQRILGENVRNEHEVENNNWPNSEDLHLSHTAILTQHEIYGFYPRHFYKGLQIDTTSGGSLKASHSAEIGMFALSRGNYYMAIEWLEFATNLIHSASDDSISRDLVMNLLDVAIIKHNEITLKDQNDWDSDSFDNYLNTYMSPTYPGQGQSKRIRGQTDLLEEDGEMYGNDSYSRANFFNICSGKDFQPEEIKSRLKCFLERKLHPYFILNPVKVEQLSEYPFLVQMYDILGNDTIQRFYEVRKQMGISTSTIKDIRENLKYLTSASQALSNDELRMRINRRSELITGLVINDHEDYLYAAEYVYGRYYSQHSDVYSEERPEVQGTLEEYGNRMATVLYYLEEPVGGGITPFCNIGTAAQVKRGSALFWLNMYRNGTTRDDVYHGSCPVIHGHKITFNQWIRYHSNFQTFQCSLNELE